jgi:enoyl-CoA hydratase/carnithine racemase
MALILTDLKDAVGTITFNNYARRNALSRAFIQELIKALNDLIYEQVRVVIHPGHSALPGPGDRHAGRQRLGGRL